jgi:alpha-glucuronidase
MSKEKKKIKGADPLAEDVRPWWKRMDRETGKVKDPFGDEVHGVKWTVKGDGFFHQVIQSVRGWFR